METIFRTDMSKLQRADSSPGRPLRLAIDLSWLRPGGEAGGVKPCIFEYVRSEEHTSELQSRVHLVCRLLLEKNKSHGATPCQGSAWNMVPTSFSSSSVSTPCAYHEDNAHYTYAAIASTFDTLGRSSRLDALD